jgi:TolB protein
MNKFVAIVSIVLGMWAQLSFAALEIEITQGIDDARPIAIVPFKWFGSTESPPHNFAEIMSNDLTRSGKFRAVSVEDMPELPTDHRQINFEKWREKGIESLVVGSINEVSNNEYQIQYQLIDLLQDKGQVTDSKNNLFPYLLENKASLVTGQAMRKYAHRVADSVFEHLTGIKGAFDTLIAYVSVDYEDKYPYRLFVADSDGHNPRELRASSYPIMSPTWSPDARRLAYVGFDDGRSAIYIRDFTKPKAEKVAAFQGINGAPSFSPDGNRLALTLSRDGNPEIYVYEINTRNFRRLTEHWAIDTEASWSPDGKSIVFTSDRGGKPQVYRVAANGGKPKRVTYDGNYNASPSYTPDGKKLVLVHRNEQNVFHLAVYDFESKQTQIITETSLDESPSIAPNGSMVIYATVHRDRQVLAAVSTDGRFRVKLPSSTGQIKAPSWSPYLN